MGAGHSSAYGAAFRSGGGASGGLGGGMPRSRRMVALSAAAPAAPEAEKAGDEAAAGVTVDFDNDSGA